MIIWGLRTVMVQLGVAWLVCPNCRNHCAQVYREHQRKFTLFFIPLFTTSRTTVRQCSMCGASYRVGPDELRWAAAQAVGTAYPPRVG
ncbi:zinc-ribbon domain-containing protein [Skermania sp. ID1734]|uniref:zinc-ribbon domain-containing protein n=1 Tax=Skermania sp. ID1734 TaxID=2597516 RepID=UPI00163DB24D|nr:zinc-ribbon domain-containing protein [Skermania sp. ID1734]